MATLPERVSKNGAFAEFPDLISYLCIAYNFQLPPSYMCPNPNQVVQCFFVAFPDWDLPAGPLVLDVPPPGVRNHLS